MPAFLLLAILAPRTAKRVVAGAYLVTNTIDVVHDACAAVAVRLLFAEEDAAEWRRDLGLDGEV